MEVTVGKGALSASTIILEYYEIDSMEGWQLMENNTVGEELTLAYNALMGIYVWTCECLRYTVQHLFTEYEIFLVSEVDA